MIFRPALLARVRAGQPAVIVKPWSDDEPFKPDRRYPIQRVREATYEDTPMARERGEVRETIDHFLVTGQRPATLGDIDPGTAKQAGFNTRPLFLEHWREQHGDTVDSRQVWIATIELDRADRPRYLAHPIPGKQGDYTREPKRAIDDVEVVDEGTARKFATEAHKRGELLRGEQALKERARSLGRRVREETLRTGRAGVDISPQLDAIEQKIQEIERARDEAA